MNTSTTIVAELRRQRAAGNAVWPCITLKNITPLCDAHEAMTAALVAAREFIAAERRTLVECSVTPKTHTLEPDDYAEAERITDLLKLIDNALRQRP